MGRADRATSFCLETLEPRVLLAADLAGAVQAVQVIDPVVPQQTGAATILLQNQGADVAKDKIDVKVYASQDQTFDAYDVLLGTAQSKGNLKAGGSETLTVSLTFPSSLAPGSQTVLGIIDAGNKIAESNEANNVAVGSPVNVAWQFGVVTNHTGSTNLTLRDADGTSVVFSLTGGGTGEVIRDGNQWDVRLTGTTAQSLFTIQTTGGNGRVSLDDIQVQGPLGALVAGTTDLTGALAVQGAVTAGILVGSATGATITAPAIQGTTIQGVTVQGIAISGNMSQSTIQIGGPLGTFLVGGSMTGSTVQAASISSIRINGTISTDSNITATTMPTTALIGGRTVTVASDPRFINQAPVIFMGINSTTMRQGEEFVGFAYATDRTPGLTWSVMGAPTWATITSGQERFNPDDGLYYNTARLDLNPGQDVVPGRYTLTLMVADSGTPSMTGTFAFAVDVLQANVAPVANPDTKTTSDNTVLTFPAADLIVNDSDPENNPLTVIAVAATATTHGTAQLLNGTVTYTPDFGFTGPASFEYTVSNGAGGTATGIVNLNVTPANQAPTIQQPVDGSNVGTVSPFQNVIVRVLAKDPENDALTFTIVDGPAGSQLRGGQFFPAPGDTSFTAGTIFAWTAAAVPGSYQATVRVADTSGATDTVTFYFDVTA